jgi:hypothetical protein
VDGDEGGEGGWMVVVKVAIVMIAVTIVYHHCRLGLLHDHNNR